MKEITNIYYSTMVSLHDINKNLILCRTSNYEIPLDYLFKSGSFLNTCQIRLVFLTVHVSLWIDNNKQAITVYSYKYSLFSSINDL